MLSSEEAARQGQPSTSDPVESPPHYVRLSPQPLDVIEAWGLGYHLGNVLKYIARAGHKGDRLTDLRKAKLYLERAIALEEKQRSTGM